MDDLIEVINFSLEKIISRINKEFDIIKMSENYQSTKKIKIDPQVDSNISISQLQELLHGNQNEVQTIKSNGKQYSSNNDTKDKELHSHENIQSHSFLASLKSSKKLSPWEMHVLSQMIENLYLDNISTCNLIRSNSFLLALWQKLHTGHWSEVSFDIRRAFTWGSIVFVGLMLKHLLLTTEKGSSKSSEIVSRSLTRIVQACDRGLLMGAPIEENPLHVVASVFNEVILGDTSTFNNDSFPLPSPDKIPKEAVPLTSVVELETQHFPSLQEFILRFKEPGRPLKITGITDAWPALSKWDLSYLHKVAGTRTVPVEVGRRYSDSDWSQTLISLDYFLSYLTKRRVREETQTIYLAQHQIFEQIPELLSDIVIPDYCYTGEKDPVTNIWIGPEGTVTPLHFDPDHNIFIQLYGYKTLLIFAQDNSRFLYAFDDPLLSNTARVNLEEVTQENLDNTWPLLKNVNGYYLTLGPGEALYMPPKWWHYVRSLSTSISLSFWWK